VTARFGLAAVAENRGQWDAAKTIYDTVAADPAAMASIKSLAIVRAAQVDQLRRPLYVSPTTAPSTVPTTVPTTNPAPSTAPTTGPVP